MKINRDSWHASMIRDYFDKWEPTNAFSYSIALFLACLVTLFLGFLVIGSSPIWGPIWSVYSLYHWGSKLKFKPIRKFYELFSTEFEDRDRVEEERMERKTREEKLFKARAAEDFQMLEAPERYMLAVLNQNLNIVHGVLEKRVKKYKKYGINSADTNLWDMERTIGDLVKRKLPKYLDSEFDHKQ